MNLQPTPHPNPTIAPTLQPVDLSLLPASDLARFLGEVDFALTYELDEEDAEPHELEAFRQAQADAQAGCITPVLLKEALKCREQIQPDWLVLDREIVERWDRVFAAFSSFRAVMLGCVHQKQA